MFCLIRKDECGWIVLLIGGRAGTLFRLIDFSGLRCSLLPFRAYENHHIVARMVKQVDTRDLKSLGPKTAMPVRVRLRAPTLIPIPLPCLSWLLARTRRLCWIP